MLRLLIRVVVALAILGLVAHEGGQILFAQTKADDIAQEAAAAGAQTFAETKNVSKAKADATAHAESRGARLRRFTIQQDGKVTVTVVLRASTLIIRRVSFLRHFGIRRATETGSPPVL